MSKVLVISNHMNGYNDIIPQLVQDMGFITIKLKGFDDLFSVTKTENVDCIIISGNNLGILTEDTENNILHSIKKDKSTYNIPVLVILEDGISDENIEKLLKNGMDDYIITPVNKIELKTKINILTKLKKVTENTKEERQFVYTILDSVDSMIVITDFNYNILRCNDYTSSFFCMGGTPIGRNFVDIAFGKDDYYKNVTEILKMFMESESKIFRPEISLIKDGAELRFKWSITKNITSEGNGALIFVGHDNSGTKRYETMIESLLADSKLKNMQLEEANALLEIKNDELYELNQLKTEYMSIASHDLRSPISQIIGLAQLFLRSKKYTPTEAQRHIIEKMLESAEFQLSLVSDILDITRIETGNMNIELEPTNINKLLQKSASVVEELTKNKDISLSVKETNEVQLVKLDKLKIQQVINNLVVNAVKFTNEGGRIDISASIDDEHLFVSVKDTGTGIKQEDIKVIFEKFNKSQKTGTLGEKGTGLGLSICKKFVELHGGKISVESNFGEGSNFMFEIPVMQ